MLDLALQHSYYYSYFCSNDWVLSISEAAFWLSLGCLQFELSD